MRVVSLGRGLLFLCSLLVVNLCNADHEQTTSYEVVGIGECGDCKENNFKTREAFSGLYVTIDCKFKTGEIKRIGDGELDEGGKFKISLPQQNEKSLKEECYAQLHSAAAIPCPTDNGLDATKIIFKSQTKGKYTFTPTKTLQFSSALCTSKFLWPYFKYPPLSKTHSWKKKWPKISFPPLKKCPPLYKPPVVKSVPPPTPVYKLKPPTVKPLPPHAPIYKPKPKPPVVKPLPPPTPIYKPKPPIYKPKPPVYQPPKKSLPPPTPIYKPKPKPPVVKPLPPPTPVYKPKPKPPVVKQLPPPAPTYKPPVVDKPLPPPFPQYPIPPLFKKPCPPFSKIPPKYFKHPKLGYFPPLPPFFPHP